MQVELGIVVHTCCGSSCKGKTGELQERSVSLLKRKKKKLEFEADMMAQQVKALAALATKPDTSQGENQVLKVVL